MCIFEVTLLGLVVTAPTAYGDFFQNCQRTVNLFIGQSTAIVSDGFPDYSFNPVSSCQYNIVAPGEYFVQLVCDINMVPVSRMCVFLCNWICSNFCFGLKQDNDCKTQRFYVGKDGNTDLSKADYYCGVDRVSYTSSANNLMIGGKKIK